MGWIRELLFGNWRNKGVALFFAVTIWFVAYQSEKQDYGTVVRVEFRCADPERTIITSIKRPDQQTGVLTEFDGRVRFLFSGPRKQIDKIRQDPPASFTLQVPREKGVHAFSQDDFGFPRDGVEITQFSPESVQLAQEESVTLTVQNMADRVTITNFREGYEVASKEVHDVVSVTGPASIVDRLGFAATVSMDYVQERFDGRVDVQVTHPEEIPPDLVKRSVKVRPSQINVTAALRASMESLAVEAMRITFRVPPVKIPIKILLDEAVEDTIPVEFYGRKDDIARLRDRLRAEPGYALGVRVPSFERDVGGQFTFTEDALELPGFPGIQIRQHENRRKEKKVAWSYTVVPVKEEAK